MHDNTYISSKLILSFKYSLIYLSIGYHVYTFGNQLNVVYLEPDLISWHYCTPDFFYSYIHSFVLWILWSLAPLAHLAPQNIDIITLFYLKKKHYIFQASRHKLIKLFMEIFMAFLETILFMYVDMINESDILYYSWLFLKTYYSCMLMFNIRLIISERDM